MRSPNLLTAAFALVLLAAPAAAEEIIVKHAQGEARIEQNPQTVLTFDYAVLDTLDAIGVEVAGVPGSNLPGYLQKYADDKYLKVGSLFEPDYEAVAAAAPDLVIVAARSSGTLPELAKIAPTIDLTNDWARFIPSVEENARTLGEIFGKSGEVEALIAKLDAAVAGVKKEAAGAGTALVVLTSAGEVTAFGPGSRFGWIYETLGFKPAVENVAAATHGDVVSFEYILEANPDWLFVIDRDAATGAAGAGAAILDNELVAQTTAAKEKHVVDLDPVRSYVVNGGVRAVTVLVEQIAAAVAAD